MKKLLFPLCLVATLAHAEDTPSVYNMWEIVCDNTRTCRAAGFTDGDAEDPASLLLTRQAGKGQQITADIKRTRNTDGDEPRFFPKSGALYISNKYAGPLHFDKTDVARLTPHQTQSIVNAITHNRDIRIRSGEYESIISNDGGQAALLKMDTLQGRLGTTSAVTRRGTKTEVLPALPAATIERKPIYSLDVSKWKGMINVAALKKEVLAGGGDRCYFDTDSGEFEPTVEAQLTPDALLISVPCISASTPGIAFWRINTQSPYRPEEITLGASGFEDGDIVADLVIERSEGECYTHRQWAWTGETFELTAVSSSGECAFIRGESPWDFPTFVTEVK